MAISTALKIRIDKAIGTPLLVILNIFARFAGFMLHINHSFKIKPHNIIVSKFLGMGSIIQCTPLLQTLKANFPEARLIFLTSVSNKKFLNHYNFIDEVITLNDRNLRTTIASTFRIVPILWKLRNTTFYDLEIYSNFSTILSLLSLSRNRIGFYNKGTAIKMGIHTHMMYFNPRVPIAQTYLQMARLTGCGIIINELAKPTIKEDEKNSLLQKIIIDCGLKNEDKIIIINPNASDLRTERRWSINNFKALIVKIIQKYNNHCIVLIGSPSETAYVSSLFNLIPDEYKERIVNSAGKIDIAELTTLIDCAELLITNDTGPMHIAFALKKDVVAIFGPTHPNQYGNTMARCIYKNVYCSPCVHEFLKPPCKGNNICISSITVDEVMHAVNEAIESIEVKSEETPLKYSFNNVVFGQIER